MSGDLGRRPTPQSMAEEAMLPKATKGKRMALSFLSKVGSKEKYSKRLEKLTQSIRRPLATVDRPEAAEAHLGADSGLQGEEGLQQRKGFAARLLAKRGGTDGKLSFGSHRLGSGRHKAKRNSISLEQPEPLHEDALEGEDSDDAWGRTPRAEAPAYVFPGANPHSCSSKSRSLPQAHSIDSDKLLFQNPFSEEAYTKERALRQPPTAARAEQQPGSKEPDLADERDTNPFLSDPPAPQQQFTSGQPDLAQERGTNPFLSAIPDAAETEEPQQEAEETREYDVSIHDSYGDDEIGEGNAEDDGQSWQALAEDEVVQEMDIDPGMGHLIAGSFSHGADTVSVSSAPPRTPRPTAGDSPPFECTTLPLAHPSLLATVPLFSISSRPASIALEMLHHWAVSIGISG